MGIKHYYAFGNKMSGTIKQNKLDRNAWENLRKNNKSPKEFAIEKTRKDWIQNCLRQKDYRKTAQIICFIIKNNKWEKIVSLGIGKGILEYYIKKFLPETNMKCTDFTPESLQLLKNVFTECDRFSAFDMLNDNYNELENEDVVIINRLSTEFTKKQWKEIFEKLYLSNIHNILYIPTEILTLKMSLDEKRNMIANMLQGKNNIFCGWMYTQNEFKSFFLGTRKKPLYEIKHIYRLENSAIFELHRNSKNKIKY